METIYLEFKHSAGNLAANGTDVTFYIDGRWNASTASEKIYERVAELREQFPKYRKQLFVGYTHSQTPFYNCSGGAIKSMDDPNPPEWSKCCEYCGHREFTARWALWHYERKTPEGMTFPCRKEPNPALKYNRL